MKKIFKCYLLIIFLFLIFTFNVDAIVNYTGSGTANYFGSGTSGKCTGRYCLKLSNILKFTLVKLDSNGEIQRIGVSNGYYMIRRWGETANTYENRFINDNDAGSKLIYGIIEHGGSYNQNAYGFTELKNVFSNIHKILPVKGGTDFSDNNLRDAIIGRNGIETYEYKKVVLEIL